MKHFAFPTLRSLYIEVIREGCKPANATGFVVQSSKGPHLITNRHVVTGTDNITGIVKWIPTELKIMHHKIGCPGEWVSRIEPLLLYNEDQWSEHPVLKEKADFVAVPISNLDDVDLYFYDPAKPWCCFAEANAGEDFLLGPADVVSIVGFPFGKSSSGFFPIWVSGFLASELSENYLGLPIQLVDSRTRVGQSGSPVFAYRAGGLLPTSVGTSSLLDGPVGKFLGIYSGRIDKDSDIGMIWKASALDELIQSL